MAGPQSRRYKYCIVPMCKNTSVSAPEKRFLNVPTNSAVRKRWCQAMRRDAQKNPPFSENSTRHVCEDHFDMETDIKNYMRYKLQGGRLYLKPGVVPHIFECQKMKKAAASTERAAKRQRMIMVNDLLHNAVQPHLLTSVVPVKQEQASDDEAPSCDKAIQVVMKPAYCSKGTNTVQIETAEVGCSITPTTSDATCAIFNETNEVSFKIVNVYSVKCGMKSSYQKKQINRNALKKGSTILRRNRRLRKIKSCNYCCYKTKNSSHLKEHTSQQHTKEFTFVCEVCSKGFAFKCRLEAHQKTHQT